MKMKQEIHWKSSVEDRKDKKNRAAFFISTLEGTLLFAVCTTVFFCAAFFLLEDVYGWGEFEFGKLFRIFLLTAAVSGIMEGRLLLGKWLGRIVSLVVFLIGCYCFVWFLRYAQGGEEVWSGICSMCSEYVFDWNHYYGTDLFFEAGELRDISAAVDFVLYALCFFLVWWAKLSKETMLPVVAPLLVFVGVVLVGYTPEGWGILLMFVGVLLANSGSFIRPEFRSAPGSGAQGRNRKRWLLHFATAVCVVLLCVVVNGLAKDAAKESVGIYYEKAETMISDVIETVSEWEIWERFEPSETVEELTERLEKNDNTMEAELSNDTPTYQNKPVLQVKLEERPYTDVYLKGFSADRYEDGVWKSSAKAFEKACKSVGYETEMLAKQIVGLGMSKLNGGKIKGRISYMRSGETNTYLPYFAEFPKQAAGVSGDGFVLKDKGLGEISFSMWEYDSLYALYMDAFEDGVKKEWEKWYEYFVVKQYLSVPKDMQNVKQLAQELRAEGYENGMIRDAEDSNEERMNKAYLVSTWFRKNAQYSLHLEELPKGSDPTEYFLGSSRTGYCMHFASAGTLLLRELGVPARYVSGYIVPSDSFSWTIDGYEAMVMENKAHAWVEIYLDGIGWVPVEVTTGYSGDGVGGGFDMPLPTPPPTIKPQITETPQITAPPQITESPQTTLPEKGTPPTITQVPPPTGTPAPTGGTESVSSSGTGEVPVGEDGTKSAEGNSFIGKIFSGGPVAILVVLLVLLSLMVVFAMVVRALYRKGMQQRLQKKRNRLGNRRLIHMLNRKIYRRLRRTGKILKLHPSDAEYEGILKRYYKNVSEEDWSRYMRLVKEAAFSCNEFSEEEVAFCCGIYQTVIYKGRKKEKKTEA